MDKGKLLADAAALLKCDGPHLRAWARERPDEFVQAVHGVATFALVETASPPESKHLLPPPPLKPAPPPMQVMERGAGGRLPRDPKGGGLGSATKHTREES